MEGFSTRKKPYQGVWVVCLILLAVPALVYAISFGILQDQVYSDKMCHYEAAAFGGMVGTLFALSFMIAGGMKRHFAVVVSRVKEFFENLSIEASLAFEGYFINIKEKGMAFWLILVCILVNFVLCFYGVYNFIIRYWQ